jgi:hypothetical protein
MPWNRSDLEAGRLVWLLNLTIRGKLYRFSTDVLNVSNADASEGPSSLQYTAGLEFLEYEDTIGLMEAEASSREISVSVLFQSGQEEGWDSIADTSRDIGTATGELSLHIVGEDYGNRQIILSGFLDSPSYGAVNEPVSFTLQESDHLDPLQFPPAQSVIDQTSWPFTTVSGNRLNIDDSARGQHYPWVFGQPGTHPPLAWWGQTKALLDATPAMLVRIDETAEDNATNACKFVIAGHETWSDPDYSPPGSVVLFSDSWSVPAGQTVTHEQDGHGNTVSVVTMTSTGPSDLHYIQVGQEVWCSWAGRGGVLNKDRTAPMIGAGEIIEYLLDHSGLRIDTLRSRAVLNEVNGYALDFWINEPRSPLEIISEDILPALPLSPQIRADGLGFVYWKWDATKHDATEAINIDREFGDRVSPVDVSPVSEVFNNITIRYAMTGPDGSYRKQLTYSHENPSSSNTVIVNPYAWASWTRYGKREAPILELPVVERDETALAVLDWKIRFHSQTRRSVTYRLDQKYQSLEAGDVVTLTDSATGFDEAVCIVTGVVRAPGVADVSFVTVPHWARDALV